jgi:perosamine synthetase
MNIPLSRPTLRRKDFDNVLSCLVSDRIAPGPVNHDFTASLCRVLSVAGGVTLASYLSSIHCAFEFLELSPGDRVVLSALAPQEYLRVIESRGLVAMFADVEVEHPVLRADRVEPLLASGAKAIVLHYCLGFLPDSDDLFELGVPVIEDLSESCGGSWGGKPCGSRGQVGLLSLGSGGIVTTGGGAAVFTRERRSVKRLRNIAETLYPDQRLPDMNAALGITQLREIDRFLSKRSTIVSLYRQAMQSSRHKSLYSADEAGSVAFSFPVLVKNSLPEVRRYAGNKGVETRCAFKDAIIALAGNETGESEGIIIDGRSLPNCKELLWRCLLFPLYPSLGKKDIQHICKVLTTLP